MYTETKSQPDLGSPRPSSKLIKKSAIVCYDFLIFSQFMSKFTQTEKIITKNGWLFNKFAGGTWRSQIWLRFCLSVHTLSQRRLDSGMDTPGGFFQLRSQKEYQKIVIIPLVHLEKIKTFCFMHRSVAQKLALPHPLEN